ARAPDAPAASPDAGPSSGGAAPRRPPARVARAPRRAPRAAGGRDSPRRARGMRPLHAVGRLAALRSQVPRDPYVALGSRLEPFRAETLSDALEERRAVRMTLLRGTLHLVTAGGAVGLRAH